jgi:hypothetical protein
MMPPPPACPHLPPNDDLRDEVGALNILASPRAGLPSDDLELTRNVWSEHVKRNRRPGGWEMRIIVYAASFSSLLCVSVVLPFFQQYASKELRLRDRAIGLILSVSPAAQLLTSSLWTALQTQCGRGADSQKRRLCSELYSDMY